MSKEQELLQKIKNLEEANMRLSVEVHYKAQDNARLSDEIIAKTDEIKYYESCLTSRNITVNNTIDETRSEDGFLLQRSRRDRETFRSDDSKLLNLEDINQSEEEEEEILSILNELGNLLRESAQNAYEVPMNNSNSVQMENFNLFCRAVLVIFVNPDSGEEFRKPQFYIQTFKIDLSTTFVQLKKAIFSFWDIKDRDNEFSLKFVDDNGESSNVKNESEYIDAFLKGKSNMKKAKFVLLPHKLSNAYINILIKLFLSLENFKDFKSIGESNEIEESKNQNKVTIDSATERFFSRFVGLTNYLQNKFMIIKMRKTEPKQMNTANKDGKAINRLLDILHFLLLMTFMTFTVFSLVYKNPPNECLGLNQSLIEAFSPRGAETDYLSKEKIIGDILKRTEGITYDGYLFEKMKMVSRMRISFYRVQAKIDACKFTEEVCYYERFDSGTSVTNSDSLDYFENMYFKNDTLFDKDSDVSNYFILAVDDSNYVTDPKRLFDYYFNIFSSFSKTSSQSSNQYVSGKLGTYYGNAYDIYINIHTVNSDVLKSLLSITTNDSVLWDKGLRAVLVSFTVYHIQSNFYFYVTFLYELNTDGAFLPAKISAYYFKTNIYFGDKNTFISILDIIRLLISILMIFFILKDIFTWRKEIRDKFLSFSLFNLLMEVKIISELFTAVLFLIAFVIKQKYLFDLEMNYFITDYVGQNWVQLLNTEFYQILNAFVIDNILESLMFCFLSVRFFMAFYTLKRYRSFSSFVSHSFKKFIVFFLVTLGLLFALSVFSNNLFGSNDSNFEDFGSSLINVLMFSIGHYSLNKDMYKNFIWFMIFIFILLFMTVYFLFSSFSGLYSESFRINSIRKGYSYDIRNVASEKIMKYTEFKIKEDKNKKSSIKMKEVTNTKVVVS